MPAHRLSFPTASEFEDRLTPIPMAGCWIWLGAVDRYGYGTFIRGGKNFRTHRYAWTLYRGPIPGALQVLHSCDTPCCVNPDHLFLGTPLDNARDRGRKGRYRNQFSTRSTP